VDESERTKLPRHGIPGSVPEKAQSEAMPGLGGVGPKLIDQQDGNHNHNKREDERGQPGNFVAAASSADERARAPRETRGGGCAGRSCHFMWPTLLNQGDSLLLLVHDFLR